LRHSYPEQENDTMAGISFDQRDGWIWFNGEIVPWKDAKVHVLTHGLHYGSSVFEGERAYDGVIFKSTEHSIRFRKSAEIMDFEIPYSVEELNAAKDKVVALNGGGDQYVRPVAWRGSEMMAVSAQHNKIHVAIATWAWPSMFDPETKMKGIKLDIADYRRPDPACAPVHAKAAGLYMICTISKHKAEKKGYADAMMLDWQGRVAECTGANIFFTRDGAIHTPIADCFLNGITRQTVIALAKEQGLEIIERRIMPEELSTFNECFIVGSAAEVTPVAEIGPYRFTPGNISRTMMDAYTNAVRPKSRAA
jgi:branched-chain amino acid aminotransferase